MSELRDFAQDMASMDRPINPKWDWLDAVERKGCLREFAVELSCAVEKGQGAAMLESWQEAFDES